MKPSIWTSMLHCVPAVEQARELVAACFEYAELSCEAVVDPETGQFSRAHAGRLRQAADRAGLAMRQVHYPIVTTNPAAVPPDGRFTVDRLTDFTHAVEERREWDLRGAEELLGLCPILGIEVMVVHPGGYLGWKDDEELDAIRRRNIEALCRLVPAAEENGVIIAVENMARMGDRVSYCADFEQLIDLVDATGSKNVGVCFDTSHANVMKVDIPAAIRRVGHRLAATHLSDNLGAHDDHLFPYSGRIQWAPVVQALRDIGYTRLFNLETPGENRCPPHVVRLKTRHARQLLDAMLAEA